jgi:hypothetical protein
MATHRWKVREALEDVECKTLNYRQLSGIGVQMQKLQISNSKSQILPSKSYIDAPTFLASLASSAD